MLSIKEILNKAWDKFLLQKGFFIGMSLGFFLLSFLNNFLVKFTPTVIENPFLIILINIGGSILSIFLAMAWYKILLDAYDGKVFRFKDFLNLDLVLSYVATSILYSIIVVVGFFLLIIPGFIWLLMFSFSPLMVLDRGLKPFDALKTSADITAGRKWQLLGMYSILCLINLAGFLALGVGLLISVPVTMLAFIDIYRTLIQTSPVQK
jgi:uncharacterized membrane protein